MRSGWVRGRFWYSQAKDGQDRSCMWGTSAWDVYVVVLGLQLASTNCSGSAALGVR